MLRRMGVFLGAVPALLVGCGRLGFDPLGGGDDGGGMTCGSTPQVNHRSVGSASADLAGGRTATVDADSCTVVFASALPRTIGEGDQLVLGGETLYVAARMDDVTLALDRAATQAHASEPAAIHRAFATFDDWETARQGDLVAEDRVEIAAAYDDGPFLLTAPVDIDGWTTDAMHFIRVTAALGHRHHGVAGAGVLLDGQSQACNAFDIQAENVQIAHMELVHFSPANSCGPAGVIVRAPNAVVRSMLIHDYMTPNPNGSAAVRLSNVGGASAIVQNVIAYNGRYGIRVPPDSVGAMVVQNCTFYAMSEHGVGLGTNGGTLMLANTLVVGSTSTDIDDSTSGGLTQQANASSDPTATGTGSVTGVTAGVFASTVAGTENLHLVAGATVIGRGIDLSPGLTDDIDEAPRTGAWDIGADQH